jgi:zinc protease
MAASMITMGGAGLTRQQISDRFDQLRTQVDFNFSQQTLTVTLTTVREHLPAAVKLIGQLLRAPAFPAEPLEEQRRQWLAGVESQRREPEQMAANALARHGNPYPKGDLRHAQSFEELEQSIKAITVPQLQAFARRFLHAEVAEFAAVGDMDAAAVRAALAHAFGDWRAGAGAARYQRAPQPLVAVPPVRLVLAAPDKQNATLRAQLPLALNDTHTDYVSVMLANYMLGGSESSRLWMRVRERDGLSYDVRSYVQWNPHEANSLWIGSAIFAPQNRDKVEAAWREELERARREGFTQAELDEAKAGLLNLRRLARAQDDWVARAQVSNLHLQRTFAVAQRVDEQIAKLTLAEVNAAWRRHFDPAKLAVAWAGDFKAAP